jgi:hypothetical protein
LAILRKSTQQIPLAIKGVDMGDFPCNTRGMNGRLQA